MKFCAELLFPPDENENDKNTDEDSVDSEVTFDFEAYCRSLDENEDHDHPMSRDDKASMAILDDKFSKGSVDVARGKRMTLMPNANKKEARRKTVMKKARKTLVSKASVNESPEGLDVYASESGEF